MTAVSSAYVDLRPGTTRARRKAYLVLCWLIVGSLDSAEAFGRTLWRWAQREIVGALDLAEKVARLLLPRSPGKRRRGHGRFPASMLIWAVASGVHPSSVIMAQRAYAGQVGSGTK